MNKREVICFIFGAAAGVITSALTAGLYFRKKYSKLAEEEITKIEYRYGVNDRYIRKSEEEEELDLINISRKKDREKIKEHRKKETIRTDYKSCYNARVNGDVIENPDPEIEEDIQNQEENEYEKWKNQTAGKGTEIIEDEVTLEDIPGFIDRRILYYYPECYDIVTDEDGNIEEDEGGLLIGNSIADASFCDAEDGDTLHVMNYNLHTLYTVVAKEGTYFAVEDK